MLCRKKTNFMSTISKNEVSSPNSDSDSYLSLEEFLRLYSDIEDGFKYEWNQGKIEKTTGMNQEQASIQNILMRLFFRTKTAQQGGLFCVETDMKTSESQLRRPDLAIYLANQEPKMVAGKNQIAVWVGEIISETDNINRVNAKLDEYFAAGVQVVWHIFPTSKQVYVYTAPDEVTICRNQRICDAQSALGDFKISAAHLFAYKTKHLTT